MSVLFFCLCLHLRLLSQPQVSKLAKKLRLVPRQMDPDQTDHVTFEMFRNWIMDAGRHWSDLMVLPEGVVFAIREKSAKLLPSNDIEHLTLHVRGIGVSCLHL